MTTSDKKAAWISPIVPGLKRSRVGRKSGLPNRLSICEYRKSYRVRTPMASVPPTVDKAGKPGVSEKWIGDGIDTDRLISMVKFNADGLVPAIAQQWDTGEVLMMAWMNAESIRETMRGGRAVYYSRSRKELWRKGDTSGQIQVVCDVLLDCDGDTVLVKVDQLGVACHTGRRSCFYTAFRPPSGEPEIIADVLMDPKELYKKSK